MEVFNCWRIQAFVKCFRITGSLWQFFLFMKAFLLQLSQPGLIWFFGTKLPFSSSQPAHEKIGVVDSQWIIHQVIPSLGSQVSCHQLAR